MKILQVLDKDRNLLAEVTWQASGVTAVESTDSQLKADLLAIVEIARRDGVPLRTGGTVERDGRTLRVEEVTRVAADDERFLSALGAQLSRRTIRGKRVFGLARDVAGRGAS